MNEDTKYWSMIAELDWANIHKTKGARITNTIKLVRKYKPSELKALRSFVSARYSELDTAVSAYEEKTGKSTGCGDDGYSDLLHHVIGLGQKSFDAAMQRPGSVITRGIAGNYTESFAYTLHTDQLLEDLQPARYVKWAAKSFKEIQHLLNNCTDNKRSQKLNLLLDVMRAIAWGNFDVSSLTKAKTWYNDLEKLTGEYSVPNLVGDILEYAPYFDPAHVTALPKPTGIPAALPKEFNRTEAVAKLNADLVRRWDTDEVRNLVLNQGFVPFNIRSNVQLQEDLHELEQV